MQSPNRSRWPIRDILALAVVALCALIVLAALLRPGVGFSRCSCWSSGRSWWWCAITLGRRRRERISACRCDLLVQLG